MSRPALLLLPGLLRWSLCVSTVLWKVCSLLLHGGRQLYILDSQRSQWVPVMTQSQQESVSKDTKTFTETFQTTPAAQSSSLEHSEHVAQQQTILTVFISLNILLHFGAMRRQYRRRAFSCIVKKLWVFLFENERFEPTAEITVRENQWILCSLFVLVRADFLFGLLSQSPASVVVYVSKGDRMLQTKRLPESAFLHAFQLSELSGT